MDRRTIITVVVLLVVGAVVLALLQYILKVHGGVLKLAISGIVAVIAAGIAYRLTPKPG